MCRLYQRYVFCICGDIANYFADWSVLWRACSNCINDECFGEVLIGDIVVSFIVITLDVLLFQWKAVFYIEMLAFDHNFT